MKKSVKSVLMIIALALGLIATIAQPAGAINIDHLPYRWKEVTDRGTYPIITSKTDMTYIEVRFVNGYTYSDRRVDVSTWPNKLANVEVIDVTRTYSTY